MQSGDGSRSNTPIPALDGRVMFTSHPSLPPLSSSSSYPPVSSPSAPQLGHTLFSGIKYLPSTPPEAHSRYMSDTYRVSPSEPVVDQARFLVDPNRLSADPYRQQQQPTRGDDRGDYHRSSEDLYQSNNPIDLQRISTTNQQLTNAQKIVSELQRLHSDPQRQMDELRAGLASEQLLRHNSHTNSNSLNPGLNYRHIINETHRLPPETSTRVLQESMFRTHADPQRLVQESFREYINTSQRHFMDGVRMGGNDDHSATENMRYVPVENLRTDSHRYGLVVPRIGDESAHNIMPENLRISSDVSHTMVAENLRVVDSHTLVSEAMRVDTDTPHSIIPENLRLGSDTPHSMIPENLRIGSDTPHSMVPENLRIGSDTPHSMVPENLRIGSDTPHSMVPENLCLTEPSHQILPENLHIRHDNTMNGRQNLTNNGIIANGRILNHSHVQPAESPIPMMRPHYNPSPHRMIPETHSMRVQSPHYTENLYRNDIHNNIGTPAPPTPAPSVPPVPDQASTPLPQYYYSHSSHPNHNNQFSVYMNDSCDDHELQDSMTLEEKIERGYQDIKPFDQDYPVSLPMMHMSQDVLPPPQVPKPPKPKKPKEPKPPRLPIVHKCSECLRVFKNSTQLKNHMWRHTGEKPFTCDECGSKFTQQGNLRAHRRIHTGERPYHCLECKACFTQLSTLKTHQKIHSDERPYKCNECDAAFRQIANLKTHQVTHTGERPHKCDQCDKAFTQKSNLKAHKNRVHSGEGMSVPAKRGRKKNPVAIKPYNCLECGAKFTVLSNLKIHAKLHSGDKPFECDHCGAGFAQRSNLKTHVQRMHGRMPGQARRRIRCDECPAMFRLRRCLKTHKKRRHPIKSLKIKILRESNYHLNSAVVEGVDEDVDDDEDGEEDDEDDDEDDDLEAEEEEEMEEKESVDGNGLSGRSKYIGEDVYESSFNSADEEGITDYRSRERETCRNPIDRLVEPKVEMEDAVTHSTMQFDTSETDVFDGAKNGLPSHCSPEDISAKVNSRELDTIAANFEGNQYSETKNSIGYMKNEQILPSNLETINLSNGSLQTS